MLIPVFEALITDEYDGIMNISLVDSPAVEKGFHAFNKNVNVKFSVQNTEKRLVFGVLMRADFNIYRYDDRIGEYYIRYSKETIKKMAEKMLLDKNHNNVNLMHVDGSNVNGVNMIELFIKDVENGLNPIGFEDIEDGSLFATFHVENDEIWDAIKDGTFKGFSIEGYFDINKINKEEAMSLKAKFIENFMKFGEVNTDKGLLYWFGDGELVAGEEVYQGEERNPAEDGSYLTEDGKEIKVVDGKVSEIVDPKAEVSDEEPMEEKMEETIIEVEEPEMEEPKEEIREEEYVTKAEYNALKSDFDELRMKFDELLKEVELIKEELKKPAEKPIEEQFEVVKRSEKKMGNAARILSHLND